MVMINLKYAFEFLDTDMAQSSPLLLRLIASSVSAANRAGKIIRDVMTQGDLAIVEKVFYSIL